MSSPRRKQKRPRYWLRRLTVVMILCLPFLFWYGVRASTAALSLKTEGSAQRVQKGSPAYVLVMGVDERNNDVGRSDTMMLFRLNRTPARVDVISLPRDTRVSLPDDPHAKLNAAYSTGGAEAVLSTVSQLLQIPKPYYVKVNLQAFEMIIDRLDGVEIDVDRNYQYSDPVQDLYIDIKAGKQIMNGKTALHFVRMRYDGVTNDDIGRIKRQQQFIQALKTELAAPSNWGRIPGIITGLRSQVVTNIPVDDQVTLAKAFFDARDTLRTMTLPGQPAEDNSGDWLMNPTGWSEVKKQWTAQ